MSSLTFFILALILRQSSRRDVITFAFFAQMISFSVPQSHNFKSNLPTAKPKQHSNRPKQKESKIRNLEILKLLVKRLGYCWLMQDQKQAIMCCNKHYRNIHLSAIKHQQSKRWGAMLKSAKWSSGEFEGRTPILLRCDQKKYDI